MEVRCGNCNKLFRIADEKISASGIKFACSQCRGPVTITREEFEQYAQAKTTEPVVPTAAVQPRKMDVKCNSCSKLFRVSEDKITGPGIKFACSKCGNPVTVTREEFQQYFEQTKETTPIPPPAVPQPLKMEVRCGSCSKLFRIAEDKITGAGIKFACSKCGATVTVSLEDFEVYKRNLDTAGQVSDRAMSQTPVIPPVPSSVAVPVTVAPPEKPRTGIEKQQTPVATFSGDAERTAPLSATEPSVLPQPAPPTKDREAATAAPAAASKPATPAVPVVKAAQKPLQQAVPETKPLPSQPREQTKAAIKPRPQPPAPVRTTTGTSASAADETASTSRQVMVLAIAILIIVAVCYAAFSHFKASTPMTRIPARLQTSVDGLQVVNTSAVHDAKGDYVISGDIVNSTDVEHPAWLLVAEVFNANGVSLGKARMLNGIELYTRRDYEILAKRGANIQELKARNLQEQRSNLLPRGTAHFEITVIEAPAGIAKHSASLQPFDPVQLFNEVISEQKQP